MEFFNAEINDPWELIKNKIMSFMKNPIEDLCEIEFEQQIGASYHEMTPQRLNYRNGKRKRIMI